MSGAYLGMCRSFKNKLIIPALSLGLLLVVIIITNRQEYYPAATLDITTGSRVLGTDKTIARNVLKESLALNRTLRVVNAPKLLRKMASPREKFQFIAEPNNVFINQEESAEARSVSVVIVKSARGNSDRRNAIRETWGAIKIFNEIRFITVFLLGRSTEYSDKYSKSVLQEQAQYQDILLLDLPDTSGMVPMKTLAGMQWVHDTLPSHWIYSSADDDMSLHVPNFAKYINFAIIKNQRQDDNHEATMQQLPIMCIYSYQPADSPARDPKSKWYIPETIYPPKLWPPYCRGGWYSMSVQMAGNLYHISRWLTNLSLDDVWITGLMRIRYLTEKVYADENYVINGKLAVAPLARRAEKELNTNSNEPISTVIVSHAWGNTAGRKIDVAETLKEVWKKWLHSF